MGLLVCAWCMWTHSRIWYLIMAEEFGVMTAGKNEAQERTSSGRSVFFMTKGSC